MDTYQESPENIPSSSLLEGGFLSHLRQELVSKILAVIITASSPSLASASIDPDAGIGREYLENPIVLNTVPDANS